MATFQQGSMPNPTRQRMGLGVASVTLGFIGMMFVFLAPLGAMVSAAGLLCGIAGCSPARSHRASSFWWSLGGTLLSLAALIVALSLTDFAVLRERFGSSLFGL